MLKWTTKFAILFLALSVLGSPLLACMLPDALLNADERECCKQMADQCGQMEMPASHSCCKETVRQPGFYLINSRFASAQLQPVATLQIIAADPVSLVNTTRVEFFLQAHAPPNSPPEILSILRI